MKIKVMLEPGAYCPQKAHPEDAGFDLYVPLKKHFKLGIGRSATVFTGVHIETPKGYYWSVVNRSGLNFNHDVTLHGCGTIDRNFRGSIGVKLYNDGQNEYHLDEGDRVAQLIIHPYTEDVEFVIVESLDETERGANGFGSSGR